MRIFLIYTITLSYITTGSLYLHKNNSSNPIAFCGRVCIFIAHVQTNVYICTQFYNTHKKIKAMLESITSLINTPFGSFGFVIGILSAAFWATYFVTKNVTEIKESHKHQTSDTAKLESSLGDRFKHVELYIDEIRKDMSYLKGSLDVIRSGANPLTQRNSPISLTEKGIAVAAELNAEKIVAENWGKIYANLEANICDKNAYDIQTYCMETAAVEPELFFSATDLSFIKQFAYKQGNSLLYYSGVFGVLIRDKYLKQKGIDVSEVDVHDPAKK